MDEEVKIEDKDEIEKALREFEQKSALQQMQKSPEALKNSDIPKMVGWVMKLSGGAIKEQKTAEYVLLALVVLMVIISLFLFFSGEKKSTKPPIIMDNTFNPTIKN